MHTEPISWQRFKDADPARILAKLGADHIGWMLGHPNPAVIARSRAAGCWQANLGEDWSAYERLAELIDQNAFIVVDGKAVVS